MPDFGLRAGDTSKTVYVRLRDSTTGLGKTGLVFNSAGAVCSYTLPGAARAAITLATLASASAAWSSGGFILVDDTNCKGLYRLDLPNAAIASGTFTVISIEFDGIIEESMEIALGPNNAISDIESSLVVITAAVSDVKSALVVTDAVVDTIYSDTTIITDTDGVILGAAGVDLIWDEVLTGGTHNIATSAGRRLRSIQDFGIYDMASVWVDEAAGSSTGTTDGEDATVANRSNDFDNAVTVAASVGLDRIHVQNANSITLTGALVGYTIWGGHYTLALGSQSIANSSFHQASISGIGTGANTNFVDCIFGATTLAPTTLAYCGLGTGGTTFTLGSAGAYRMIRCYSDVAGAAAPVIDMNSLGAGTTLELRDWRGGVTLNNLTTNHVVTLDGIFGTITLNGADASVEIRGIYKALTNNLTGAPTVTETGIEGDMTAAVSDVKSALVVTDAVVDTIYSDTTEIHTVVDNVESKVDTLEARQTAIYSDTTLLVPGVSDVESSLVILKQEHSDIESALVVANATLTTAKSDTTAIHLQTTTIASDVVLIDSAVSDVESSLVIVKSDVVLIYSDTTVIEAAGGTLSVAQDSKLTEVHGDVNTVASDVIEIYSDTTALGSAVSDVKSALVVTDAVVDTVYSDTTVLVGAVSDVKSALVVTDAVVDKVYSDTTHIHSEGIIIHSETTVIASDVIVIDNAVSDLDSALVLVYSDTAAIVVAVSDVKSALVVTDAVVDTIYSDTTVLVGAVSDVKSALVVADAAIDRVLSDTTHIHSDTTVIEATGASLTAGQDSKLTEIHGDVNTVASDVVEIYSDTTALVTAVSDVKSALVVTDAVVDTIYSDTTLIHSETTILVPAVSDVKSALVVTDAVVDTIYSDTTILVPAVSDVDSALVIVGTNVVLLKGSVSDVKSALVITDAVVDTIYSDTTHIHSDTALIHSETTVLVGAVSDVKSALVVADAVIDTVYSDTTVLVPAVSDVKSALVVADAIIDTIYSDTTIVEQGGKIVGAMGRNSANTYYFNAKLVKSTGVVTSSVTSETIVGVYGNDADTDLVAGGTAIAFDTGRIYGHFTLTTQPTDNVPLTLVLTAVHGGVTYTGHIEGTEVV